MRRSKLSAWPPSPAGPLRPLLPEETILRGRYVLRGVLARGGTSVVYRALDTHLPGDWVVKQMAPAGFDATDRSLILEQFRREAIILAGLSHPGLPRVTDCFEEGGEMYLVEEFLPGQTLRAYAQDRRFDEEEVVAFGLRVLEILEYLHAHGIVYRDLKPDNIMVGLEYDYRLIDFGIARLASVGKRKDTVLMASPGFASPEHYGNRPTDARSDVFSLGATMHWLLTGTDPAEHPFMFEPPAGVSEWLADIVLTAVETDPDERFPTAAAMRAALAGPRNVMLRARTFKYPGRGPKLLPPWQRPLQTLATLAGGAGVATGLLAGTALLPVAGFLVAGPIILLGKYAREHRDLRDRFFVTTPRELQVWYRDVPYRIPWRDVQAVRVRKYQPFAEVRPGASAGIDFKDFSPLADPGQDKDIRVACVDVCIRTVREGPREPVVGRVWVRFTAELEGWQELLATILARADLHPVPRLNSALADEEYGR